MAATRKLAPLLWIALLGLAVWLIFGHGFVQYDTFYALDWGHQLAHGQTPDYSAPLAPTPHPLATALGFLLAPLGDGAAGVTLAIAFFAIGAIGYLLYRLGDEWFNPWVGAAAALLILTREPLLSDGVRAYIDIPYVALVLWALLMETRKPRAGVPVLVLLGFAGLLRPEAWLLSAAYLAYLAYGPEARERGELVRLAGLAAVAPLLWGLSDLLISGDALHSFTGTRDTVETLHRETGIAHGVAKAPFRLGEIMREPGLFGALGGALLTLLALRDRRRVVGLAAAVAAGIAFLILAGAGLAVITRYLLLTAAILAVFFGASLAGWLELDRPDPWRGRWIAFAVLVVIATVAFVPSQADRLSNLHRSIAAQQRILDDLHDLADSGRFTKSCAPVAVPNHRPVPFLALWLNRKPSDIVSAQIERPARGYFVAPASTYVERNFTLDPNDPKRLTASVPAGFKPVTANRSWKLFARC